MTVRTPTLRKWWLAVHLYTGLTLGLLISIIGITGSILVFYIEIDEWLNPELVINNVSAHPSYEAIKTALQTSESERLHAWRLEIPEKPNRAITARYYKPEETAVHGFAPLMVAINPYTGEIINKRFWGQYALTWLFDLHYTLLLDATGKVIMAVVGLFLALSIFSGLYLWWPPLSKIVTAFTIKKNTSRQRIIYDIHKISGVYPLVILLIVTFTGIALEIPEYINPAINYVYPIDAPAAKPQSTPAINSVPISVDQAVATARQLFPHARLSWIETPDGTMGTYRINLRQDFEPSKRFPKTNVWIDQYSGRVLLVNNPARQSAGNTLLSWLHPLHNGEAFGMTGRILIFVSGFACPLLFVTGLLRWLQKKRAKRLKPVATKQ